MHELQDVHLSDRDNRWEFSLNSSGLFPVKDTRKTIDSTILPSGTISTIWYKFIPRKLTIFLWRLRLDSLPVRWNMSARGIELNSIVCPVCNNGVESREHLFFGCVVARIYGVKSEYGSIVICLFFRLGIRSLIGSKV
ncbi:uncharacterized protein [Rutidosis leptorrhynchoides]|uniref:uncharacterized protein n=1 Tax=Rutidosis leptorrhynchoides TaxID=125765 RepID=UPI003A9A57C0